MNFPTPRRTTSLPSSALNPAASAHAAASSRRPAAKSGEMDTMERTASAPASLPSGSPAANALQAPERAPKRSLSGLFADYLAMPPQEQEAVNQMFPTSPIEIQLEQQAAPKRRRALTPAEKRESQRAKNCAAQRRYRERAKACAAATQQQIVDISGAIARTQADIAQLNAVGQQLTSVALGAGVDPVLIAAINAPLQRG